VCNSTVKGNRLENWMPTFNEIMGNGLTNFLQKYSKVTKEDALANNIIKFESTNLLYNKIFFYTKVNLIV